MTKTTARKKKRTCAYCGKLKPVSYDHIPPENLFARPLPGNMITVPACEGCHADTSKDDEYFRAKLSLKTAYTHPDATAAWTDALRGLRKPEVWGSRNFSHPMRRTVIARTHDGLIVPVTGYDVDMTRMAKVISRIVRGLYFRTKRTILPPNHQIYVLTQEQLPSLPPQALSWLSQIVQELNAQPTISIGDDVFQFRYRIQDDGEGSQWEMLFYRSVVFLAIAAPSDISTSLDASTTTN